MSRSRKRWPVHVVALLAAIVVPLSLTGPARPAQAVEPTGAVPVPAAQVLSGATAVAGGRGHTCAITAGGAVRCWGGNHHGELGDGTTVRRLTPVPVQGLPAAGDIRMGGDHSCALVKGGKVYCWGANGSGRLGDGTMTNRPKPAQVKGLSGVTAIAAGRAHTCAVTAGGSAYCWGNNARGQLGDGTTTDRPEPVAVKGLKGVTAIEAADAFHTCALTAAGKVYCWGWNQLGQLGDGVQNDAGDGNRASSTPVRVVNLDGATALSGAGAGNGCALVAGGQVKCWGWNTFGQLGDGTTPPGSVLSLVHNATPGVVTGLPRVTAISRASGTGQVCAITGGALWCWGHNGLGQLGNGTNTHHATPVSVSALSGVADVTGGADHTCAISGPAGNVSCWGFNNEGQLGDGTTTNRPAPVAVRLGDQPRNPRPVMVKGLSGVTAVAAGSRHTCAVVAGGGVRCWGANDRGQLGDGGTTSSAAPLAVPGLAGVTAIAAGADHTCAVLTSGGVSCWGWNGVGQLGDGSYVDRRTPVPVGGLSGATGISAGNHHACATVAGGEVRCWGHNYAGGPLGVKSGATGEPIAHPSPVAMQDFAGVTAITAGRGHTCAIAPGGEVRCWGYGAEGQFGHGGTPSAGHVPAAAKGIAGATRLAAGADHTCAALGGGTVSCWGVNRFGQVGDGGTGNALFPVTVTGLGGVTAVTAGGDHTCALLSSGGVSCWGWNAHGQLGDGAFADSSRPRPVTAFGQAASVSAGEQHTCAATTGGAAYCWGGNERAQLGTLDQAHCLGHGWKDFGYPSPKACLKAAGA